MITKQTDGEVITKQTGESSQIILDEGEKTTSYIDTRGNLTGGIGHLMTKEEQEKYPKGTKIPKEVIDAWYKEDLNKAQVGANNLVPEAPEEVKNIVTNMVFNMGEAGVKKFEKMLEAIDKKEWNTAANEMKKSAWYSQVGRRSKRLIERMRNVGL